MKRRSIAILLIVIWVIQILSSFVILSGTRYLLQQRNQNIAALERIHKTNVVFYFDAVEDINWTKEGKEFDKGGDLFDVISITQAKDSVKVICFKDQKDKLLSEMIKRERSDSKGSLLKEAAKQKIIVQPELKSVATLPISIIPLSHFILADFSEPFIQVLSPPPWLRG